MIAEVISRHAEETAFLWVLRTNAARAPHYAFKDLIKLDYRIEAHIDGLRIASNMGWEVHTEALTLTASGETFAASVLVFEARDEMKIRDMLAEEIASSELMREVVSAFGWIPFRQGQGYLDRLLASDSPRFRWIGIAGYAVHRQDPGASLKDALSDEDIPLKARAIKAVWELGRLDLSSAIRAHLGSSVEEVLFQAAWGTTLFGDPSGVAVLLTLAHGGGQYAERAAAMALRGMSLEDAHVWQCKFAARPQLQRLSVQGAGIIGDPILIPWLIEQMTIPLIARVAGEVFTMITGVDLAYHDLAGEWPEGFQAGPTEDPNDDNVEMDRDEDLPWPNPELIEQWWAKHCGEFKSGVRHLVGKPITDEWLWQVLKTGRQRQRAAAAIELSMRNPGLPLFNVKAPGFRQMEQLAKIG